MVKRTSKPSVIKTNFYDYTKAFNIYSVTSVAAGRSSAALRFPHTSPVSQVPVVGPEGVGKVGDFCTKTGGNYFYDYCTTSDGTEHSSHTAKRVVARSHGSRQSVYFRTWVAYSG